MEQETILELSIEEIQPNPFQPRVYFDPAQLEELADKCSATANDNLGKVKVLHRADMLAIYTAAR